MELSTINVPVESSELTKILMPFVDDEDADTADRDVTNCSLDRLKSLPNDMFIFHFD